MQRLEDTSTSFSVIMAILGYSICSSTLLLANKMAMVYLPSPGAVSVIQMAFGAVVVLAIRYIGFSVDWFEWEKVKAYALYVAIFVGAIYTNMQALSHSNVETVIVFRACTPLAVCICEVLFLNREYPSVRSMLSLGAVVVGALVYCLSDSQLALNGIGAYSWVIAYFLLIVLEMTYGKQLTSSVNMETVWGPVLYCNTFSILPMFLLGWSQGDFDGLDSILEQLPTVGWLILIFSCIAGTCIGYTGWLCRGMVSATTFTLVGVVNKFLTVLLNVLIWDKHSSPLGLLAVCVCLAAGVFYQQAPRRDGAHKADAIVGAPGKATLTAGSTDAATGEEGVELLATDSSAADRVTAGSR